MIGPLGGVRASWLDAGGWRVRVPTMVAGLALVAAAPDRGFLTWVAVAGALVVRAAVPECPSQPIWSGQATRAERARRVVFAGLGFTTLILGPPYGIVPVVVFVVVVMPVSGGAIFGALGYGERTLFDHSGAWVLTLEACEKPVQAIKALREAGLDFQAAKALVDGVPAVVAADLTEASADQVAQALRSARARVAVRES